MAYLINVKNEEIEVRLLSELGVVSEQPQVESNRRSVYKQIAREVQQDLQGSVYRVG